MNFIFIMSGLDEQLYIMIELWHNKINKVECVPSKDSGQPAQWPSLISLHCVLKK